MGSYDVILKRILTDGGKKSFQSPATRSEIFQSALFAKSHQIDPLASQLAAITSTLTVENEIWEVAING